MKREKGYQLIEVDISNALIHHTAIEVAVTVFLWLVDTLKKDKALDSLPVEIELIAAQYVNQYPCIGVYYLDPSVKDIGPLIEKLVNSYMNSASFIDFYKFAIANERAVDDFIRYLKE
ncbi:hypothetical protein [Hymenobacter perfusus]|uniref:Uncharacterized protein n=1 Tax=Hymenobacter perfusus TaxID=1236770 RepID=A0A3R9MFN4_9BACT|nr:hypothetical protein [Hymenobacter perfusus]RSK44793.1 hypothetical protein EI293_09820 [Hymenobacter perfusus]